MSGGRLKQTEGSSLQGFGANNWERKENARVDQGLTSRLRLPAFCSLFSPPG